MQTHAADLLGLSFRQFRYLVKKYGPARSGGAMMRAGARRLVCRRGSGLLAPVADTLAQSRGDQALEKLLQAADARAAADAATAVVSAGGGRVGRRWPG